MPYEERYGYLAPARDYTRIHVYPMKTDVSAPIRASSRLANCPKARENYTRYRGFRKAQRLSIQCRL